MADRLVITGGLNPRELFERRVRAANGEANGGAATVTLAPTPPTPITATGAFPELPFPSPGERIKSDDFKKLSQALTVIASTYALSGALFGRTLGEVKPALASQGYQIERVMSIFGAEAGAADMTLDTRRILHVSPTALGVSKLLIVVSEAVDTRRFAPNLIGMSYKQALEQMRTIVGDAALSAGPIASTRLLDLTLGQAAQAISNR